ncbi:MAG: putative minor capsid protein [Microviridae sp. ctjyu33]|nr:MAG: putative minor capsid protein [Microviridae sp. ctjyu33]
MSFPGEGLISGTIAGGLNYLGQREANKMNLRIAREQMGFQERMSSTAYQRAMQDMAQAGLNPILAAGGGASSPSGASATMMNEMSGAVSSAIQAKAVTAQIQQTKAMTDLLKADLPGHEAEAKVYGSKFGVLLKVLQALSSPVNSAAGLLRAFGK